MKPNSYKDEEFIHFVRQKTGEFKEVKAKLDSTRKHPKYDLFEIPFSDIERIQLNRRGENIPYTRNNVVNLERYILRYWQPIMGSDAVMLLLNLWEYCNRDEGIDICYPKVSDLAEMMGRSVPSITKNLKILEENNFLLVIHRLNRKANNKETSPCFKLRETVPLISREQYLTLPPSLREKHDEYIEKYGRGEIQMEYFTHSSDDTVGELMSRADKLVSKKARQQIEDIIQSEQEAEFLITKLPDELKETMKRESLHKILEGAGFSKPMRELVLGDAISIYHKQTGEVDIIVRKEDNKQLLEDGINESFSEKLQKAMTTAYGHVLHINYYTVKRYIYRVMKG